MTDFSIPAPRWDKRSDAVHETWDLIRLASDIKKSYLDLSEESKEDLDNLARILILRF